MDAQWVPGWLADLCTEATTGRSYADYRGLGLEDLIQLAQVKVLPLERGSRFVIASDHHRKYELMHGAEPTAQFIAAHRGVYEKALGYYAARGYTLIEAGDMEELWRLGSGTRTWIEAWEKIRDSYASVYRLIRDRFVSSGRYIRIWGNHDAVWRLDKYRHDLLAPVLGTEDIYEMILIGGRYLVMHGQAVDRWNNDRRGWYLGRLVSKTAVYLDAVYSSVADPDGTYPNWIGGRHRNDTLSRIQNTPWMRWLLGPERFSPYRAVECDRLYEEWSNRLGVVLICGHTHEPALFPHNDAGQATPYINTGSGVAPTEMQMVELHGDCAPQPVRWTDLGRQPMVFRPSSATVVADGAKKSGSC